MSTEAELQHQDERFELLLNLTTKITSSLDLREVLRAVAANIREGIHADAVVVSLTDAGSGKVRVFTVDFPHGKGVVKEELLVTPSASAKEASSVEAVQANALVKARSQEPASDEVSRFEEIAYLREAVLLSRVSLFFVAIGITSTLSTLSTSSTSTFSTSAVFS